MFMIYFFTDVGVDADIDVCYISALLLLHYCFTSLYKFFAPAFTRAVLIHMLHFCMLTPEYIHIYIHTLLVLYSTLYICGNPSVLKYICIYLLFYSYFTPTSLVFCV